MDVLFPKALVDGELDEKSAGRAIGRVLADWLSAGLITEPDVTVSVSRLYLDPDVVGPRIDDWNENMYGAFRQAVDKLDGQCDTQETFACKVAARDIDNDWNPMSGFAILSNPDENPDFVNTCVNGCNRDEVTSHPELYALAVCSVETEG